MSSLLDKFRKQTKLRVELRSTGAGAPLRPEQQLQILFILQEALSNVRKHAEASQVTVSLSDDGEVFVLSVLDNGVGFDLDTVRNKGDGHFGLSIMQERAQRAGLQLDIESTPDAGTMVSLLLPRAAPGGLRTCSKPAALAIRR